MSRWAATAREAQIEGWARRLAGATRNARAVPQHDPADAITLEEVYEIQRRMVLERVIAGAAPIGLKMGSTGRAKMVQMGLSDLIWGRLMSDMVADNASSRGVVTGCGSARMWTSPTWDWCSRPPRPRRRGRPCAARCTAWAASRFS